MINHRGEHVLTADDQTKAILVNIYRAIDPDWKSMDDTQKNKLRSAMDEESKSETVFKYPEREKQRNRVRDLLKESDSVKEK